MKLLTLLLILVTFNMVLANSGFMGNPYGSSRPQYKRQSYRPLVKPESIRDNSYSAGYAQKYVTSVTTRKGHHALEMLNDCYRNSESD